MIRLGLLFLQARRSKEKNILIKMMAGWSFSLTPTSWEAEET